MLTLFFEASYFLLESFSFEVSPCYVHWKNFLGHLTRSLRFWKWDTAILKQMNKGSGHWKNLPLDSVRLGSGVPDCFHCSMPSTYSQGQNRKPRRENLGCASQLLRKLLFTCGWNSGVPLSDVHSVLSPTLIYILPLEKMRPCGRNLARIRNNYASLRGQARWILMDVSPFLLVLGCSQSNWWLTGKRTPGSLFLLLICLTPALSSTRSCLYFKMYNTEKKYIALYELKWS